VVFTLVIAGFVAFLTVSRVDIDETREPQAVAEPA
jgi:hypothetical protein